MDLKNLIDKINELEQDLFGCDFQDYKQDNIKELSCMTGEELRSLDKDEATVRGYQIYKHCLYLQSRVNKYKSLKEQCEYKLNNIIADEVRNYKGVSWTLAEALATKNSESATYLKEKILEYGAIVNMGYSSIKILQDMGKQIEGIKYGKTN